MSPTSLSLLFCLFAAHTTLACYRVQFGNPEDMDIACMCNSTHCDLLDFQWPQDKNTFVQLVSNKDGARHELSEIPLDRDSITPVDYHIHVDTTRPNQRVTGYGGAFTDSACFLIKNLNDATRKNIMQSYFGPTGLDYNMGRVPISGSDMSMRAYTYDDLPDGQQDFNLERFSIQLEDILLKIPTINEANLMRQQRHLEPLKLFASNWSPPAWMKTNNNLINGTVKGDSSGPYYKALSQYFIKFLHEYERYNISFWGISPQNAAQTATIKKIWFSVNTFDKFQMMDFLQNNMIPDMIKAGLTPDKIKLLFWDDNFTNFEEFFDAALASPTIKNFLQGVAIHWYSTWHERVDYSILEKTNKSLPENYFMISTEASILHDHDKLLLHLDTGRWKYGEDYAYDILENLNSGSVGWIDWNLVLDITGGPSCYYTQVESAIIVDSEHNVYYKNPMYYALGHITRFILANSRVLTTEIRSSDGRPIKRSKEFIVASAELEKTQHLDCLGQCDTKRRYGIVLFNGSTSTKSVRLFIKNCPSKENWTMDLSASSIVSLAFVC